MKKFKFNWGWGIAILYLGFMAMILTLVFKSSQQDINLVTENYYQKDLEYQQHIDKRTNASNLDQQLTIEYDAQSAQIILTYPDNLEKIEGEALFFRPSDKKQDFSIALKPNEVNKQVISTKTMINGLWRIQIDWKASDKPYYMEEIIIVENNQTAAIGGR